MVYQQGTRVAGWKATGAEEVPRFHIKSTCILHPICKAAVDLSISIERVATGLQWQARNPAPYLSRTWWLRPGEASYIRSEVGDALTKGTFQCESYDKGAANSIPMGPIAGSNADVLPGSDGMRPVAVGVLDPGGGEPDAPITTAIKPLIQGDDCQLAPQVGVMANGFICRCIQCHMAGVQDQAARA